MFTANAHTSDQLASRLGGWSPALSSGRCSNPALHDILFGTVCRQQGSRTHRSPQGMARSSQQHRRAELRTQLRTPVLEVQPCPAGTEPHCTPDRPPSGALRRNQRTAATHTVYQRRDDGTRYITVHRCCLWGVMSDCRSP